MKIAMAITVALFIIVCPLDAEHKLKLSVSLDKGSYLLGEPVQVAISIVNISADVVRENLWGTTKVELFEEDGNNVANVGIPISYFLPSAEHLEPGDNDYKVVELNMHFGKIYSVATSDHYFDPGKYRLRILFHPLSSQAETSETSFMVVKPSGNELIVYDKYVDLVRGEAKEKYSAEQVAIALRNLCTTYPRSVYCPMILNLLEAIYDFSLGNHIKAFATRKELVEKYPWTVRSWQMLDGVLHKMNSNSKRVDYLKKVKNNSKNTLMEKMVDKKIHEMITKEGLREK